MDDLTGWLTAGEAAGRLGVKPATLYAYVSRRVVRRRRAPDGSSRFDPAEIERLARRGRPRRPPGGFELAIESEVTVLGEDRPFYRGRDALELAAGWELEQVAGWLWDAPAGPPGQWRAAPEAVAAGRGAQAGLPTDLLPLERLQVIVPALGAVDPLRHNTDPAAVVAVGQQLIAGMVDCLPGGELAPGPIAGRLWARLAAPDPPAAPPPPQPEPEPEPEPQPEPQPQPQPEPELVGALRVALGLLADHELAASTFAARVAASVRADPYAVVTAGLAAMGGALHGGASLRAEAMLAEARDPDHAGRVVGQRLRRGERIPGLGHLVYRRGDARAGALLDRVRAAAPGHPRLAVVEAVLAEARRRRLPEPNVDLALAALVDVAGLVTGAGEAVFAVARTVGWLAHAREEYAHPSGLRPRARRPGGSG